MATDYSKKTNAELVEILKARSLPHTGKKADLVARLQQDDEKKAVAPADTKADAEDVIDWDDEVPADPTTTKPAPEAADDKGAEPAAEPEQKASTGAPETKTETTKPAEAESKPAVDYTKGLPASELEEELKKRKARAEKFGIVEDEDTALKEAEKKLQRANRFGTAETSTSVGVKGLDEALSTEPSRKRARNEQGGRGGKRRDNRNRNRHENRNQNRGGGGDGGQKKTEQKKWSDQDTQAMEARKKRFATAA
ncbi:hypothetical protein N7492_005662 [Penicillium capsulatum]|uniref:SAP domain-containing protein n=1 Tax=Penicillium capsulatum TaxID=69766 RepID=A0A9W9I9S4_9EURO|nr:hypothetical protein N7492_005662 [Penicillium capsulatum]KAJ6135241.1 hypothetical protein N7512_000401 [Penicillium capsulatum]